MALRQEGVGIIKHLAVFQLDLRVAGREKSLGCALNSMVARPKRWRMLSTSREARHSGRTS